MANFHDSRVHGPQALAELIIVEGDSAAAAVCAVRDPRFQAVLAMQGKAVNARRASRSRVFRSPWLRQIATLLGEAAGTPLPLGDLRFERVILLMDPDADGIHAGALLQIFFHDCMPALLDRHRVWMVHAPWAEIRCPGEPPLLSFQPQEFHEQCQRMDELGVACERIRHRGLATITPLVLAECCVDPATRRAHPLSMRDAALAIEIFGAQRQRRDRGSWLGD